MLASVRHRRLQVAKLRAGVVAGPLEAVREHAILCEQRADRVGELNFAPGSGRGLRQVMKNARCQDVPPDHGKVRRSCVRSGLLDDSHDAIEAHCHGLGLDHAVLEALLWRDLLHGNHQSPVVAVQQIPPEQSLQYGMVKTEPVTMGLDRVMAIVEKPKPEAAPSNLAVVGRYILTPRIFHHLAQASPGAGSEIQLTDAIASLLAEDRVLAYSFKGTRYDCGSKLGYLQATVAYGRKHPEIGKAFEKYLKTL